MASAVLCVASVVTHAVSKCLLSLSDVLRMVLTNCTFQEVDDICRVAGGSAVYDEFFFCKCAPEFVCALDYFARLTFLLTTFLTLTNGIPENKDNNKITELRTILQRESKNS